MNYIKDFFKKSIKIIIKIIVVMLLIIIALFIIMWIIWLIEGFKHGFTVLDSIKKETGINFSICEDIYNDDSHGGFLGDGELVKILNCNNTDILNKIKEKNWKSLPLSENLNLIMYGGEKDGRIYSYNLAEENNIPKIETGYYYFIDRYAKYYGDLSDIHSDEKIFDRYSFNFTIIMYDIDKNYIYYYELDT